MRAWLKDILSFLALVLGAIIVLVVALGRSLLEFLLGRKLESYPQLQTVVAWFGGLILVGAFGYCAFKAWKQLKRPVAWNRKDRERSQLEDEWL